MEGGRRSRTILTFLAILISPILACGIDGTNEPEATSPAAEPCEPLSGQVFGLRPLCITWRDTFQDEEGFVIELEYGGGGESFRYEVEREATSFVFPESDSPGTTLETCRPRAGFRIVVTAEFADSDPVEVRTTAAANVGCAGVPDGPTPTR
jgi:hypothetical protein